MKKNLVYAQTSVLNEVLLVYTTRDLADKISEHLSNKDVELVVYETHSDGVVFRKKKDGIVTDDAIIRAFRKAVKKLVDESTDSEHSLVDIINDNYEFEYSDSLLTDAFFANILNIRRSGRLISVEIDI